MTPIDTLLAWLDPDPLIRGRQFRRFVVTLLRTHPVRASELAEVWLRAAWRDRWGPDGGIDAGHRITMANLGTFISETTRPSHRRTDARLDLQRPPFHWHRHPQGARAPVPQPAHRDVRGGCQQGLSEVPLTHPGEPWRGLQRPTPLPCSGFHARSLDWLRDG